MTLQKILLVTRKRTVQQVAHRYAKQVYTADDHIEAAEIAKTVAPELVIFDDTFAPHQVGRFVETTDKTFNNLSVIVVGIGEKRQHPLPDYVHAGALDYFDEQLEISIERLIKKLKSTDRTNAGQCDTDASAFFINDMAALAAMAGHSEAIRLCLNMIELVGSSRCDPVLIVGETGTGKELAARAIHNIRSPGEQFVAINCAALTANLLESELFGHERGSFTGADRQKTGLLELAGKGTVLLDEISEMPLHLQAKLLRVLQEKRFRKVGGTKTLACNATIIASSNRNLLEEVRQKKFRQDLYYRLSICPITVAALRSRDRKSDIRLLAHYFLHNSAIWPEKSSSIKSLTPLALEALDRHEWPGNVRELRNVVERAILVETTDKIGLSSILIDRNDCSEQQRTAPSARIHDFSLARAERELISRALRETGWQKTKAAALLGITRATLYAKVKQYSIAKDAAGEKLHAPVESRLPEFVASV